MRKLVVGGLVCMMLVSGMGCKKKGAMGYRDDKFNLTVKVIILEQCEYIANKSGENGEVTSLTHKGNCRNPLHVPSYDMKIYKNELAAFKKMAEEASRAPAK